MSVFPSLLAFGAACLLAASTGAIFRPGAWYETLAKPPWTPPDWLFPIAWMILYAFIAVAGWLVWHAADWPANRTALILYGLQLVLNAGWSVIFFGARRVDLALWEVVALWASIAATIAAFAPLSPLAAALMAPYLAWVSFAAALNFDIWRRQRAAV